MQCPRCQHDNPSGAKFCLECGTALARRCPHCQGELPSSAKFCLECGAALGEEPAAYQPRTRAGGAAAHIGVTAAAAPHAVPEGERKTVTALFADIKGSMELLEDLDPEEARRIVDPALQLMMEAVHRYEGYVAQSTGDGIFALFGAPVAREDHPQRALYAALRLRDEMKRYAERLRAEKGLTLLARVGVNTGEVVVRTLATGEGHVEYVPIGHSASLAARLQALAAPGSIAISEAVRKFVEGYFTLKALGPTRVKGVSEPIPVFEVTGLGPLRTPLQRAVGRGLTRFVGRVRELEALKQVAEQAKAGRGQLAAVVGEPGVGKSRLFYEFKAVAQSGCVVLETFSVSHGKASAYLPVIELLHSYFRIALEDDARARREKVIGKVLGLDRALEDTMPYLFALLGLVEGEDPLAQMDAQQRRRRTQEAIKRILLRESVNQPLLVLIEDLQWIDTETQALLNLLADAIGTAKILLLVNYRPEYSHGWGSKTYYTRVRLDPLWRESAGEMLGALLGESAELGPLKRLIIEQTEGNPFFMEEIVQSLFEEGVLVREEPRVGMPAPLVRVTKPLGALKLPPTVQGMLAARIDRLLPEQKELLQTLAVLGKEFAFSLVHAVSARGDDELNRMLAELQLAEFIYEQPALGEVRYTFKHALTQEVAYHSVLSDRRRLLHQRVAESIEALGAERVEDQLMEVAHHYSRSGKVGKAVEYLGRAGYRAAQQAAHAEAVGYLSRALELLPQLPESAARVQQELELRQSLVGMLWVTKGYAAPETVAATERVAALAEHSGTLTQLVDSVYRRWQVAFASGDFPTASALADQALDLAVREGSRTRLAMAHYSQLQTRYFRGDVAGAEEHFTTGLPFFDDPGFREFPGVPVWPFAYGSWNAWHLGRADVARERMAQAMAGADQNNPFDLTWLELCGVVFRVALGEYSHAEALAVQALARAEKEQFPVAVAASQAFLGQARARRGRASEGVALIRQGIAGLLEIGFRLGITYLIGALAEAQACEGAIGDALATAEEALQANPDELYWRPQNLRLRGELRLTQGQAELAEADFREAIALARRMGAKALELRATMSLARLLAQQGRRDEARVALAEIYNWFTEGFDTVDLKEAKALLEEL
jgi:class 3 adenylate cyclase/tetratricopeptide (TPR) repeat protein